MNAQEAASLLPLYRAGRRAEGRLQKAVRLAERDNTLRQKLSDQMEFDELIGDVIHYIKPPEDLRKTLREVSTRLRPPKTKLRQAFNPAVLAAILGLLLIAGFGVWTVMERMEKFPGRESVERMLSATKKMSGVELDPVSMPAGSLGDWFYMRGFEGYAVPPEVAALPVVGSRVLRVDGHPIAQLAVDRHDSILYVFRAPDFGIQITADQPWWLFEYDGWVAALRRHDEICQMLAFRGKKAEMKDFLISLTKP